MAMFTYRYEHNGRVVVVRAKGINEARVLMRKQLGKSIQHLRLYMGVVS